MSYSDRIFREVLLCWPKECTALAQGVHSLGDSNSTALFLLCIHELDVFGSNLYRHGKEIGQLNQ